MTCKRLFAAGVLSVWVGPLPSYDPPYAPPPYTLYSVYVYTEYLFTKGRGEVEGRELIREKVREAIVHKAGRNYQHV